MRTFLRHPSRSSSAALRLAALGVASAVLGACTTAATPSALASPDASSSPAAVASSSPAEPSPSAASPSPTPTPKVTQTDTGWGRIWDAVPASFPVPTGGEPTQVNEPVSAAWSIQGTDGAGVATELQAALEGAGYSTVALSGPLENGARIIDSVGDPSSCRVQTRITPLGGTVSVTVLYGASCPFR